MVSTNINPLGMNFFVFANRIANTTIKAAMIICARLVLTLASKMRIVVTISSAAEIADVISETLLPAFKNPIKPPTNRSTM